VSSVLYIDSPSFDGREDLAAKIGKRLGAEVAVVSSIEEFAQQIGGRTFDLYVCGDSMLFQQKIVQGWEALHKFLVQGKKEDISKLVILSNRASVIEDASLHQLCSFHKRDGFEQFVSYASALFESA